MKKMIAIAALIAAPVLFGQVQLQKASDVQTAKKTEVKKVEAKKADAQTAQTDKAEARKAQMTAEERKAEKAKIDAASKAKTSGTAENVRDVKATTNKSTDSKAARLSK